MIKARGNTLRQRGRALLRRLDGLGAPAGLLLGGAVAALVAGGVLLWGHGAGYLVVVGLLVGAVPLAFSGRPVAVLVAPPPPFTEPLEMIELPGGGFRMGSPEEEKDRSMDEGPVHEVELPPFAIGKFVVTRALYRQVTGGDPAGEEIAEGEDPTQGELPVTKVSWFKAVRFCNRLSEQVGLAPCYHIEGEQVHWERSAPGYRLPTEAEWEYAARAGTETAYSFGNDPGQLGEHAWFSKNSARRPHPVGQKKPNPWVLYDVHGNVWEWCWDGYATYGPQRIEDPAGPPAASGRVMRGGAFGSVPWELRSAFRGRGVPEVWLGFVGFRCVRGPRRQH